jgi:hypothetical protein
MTGKATGRDAPRSETTRALLGVMGDWLSGASPRPAGAGEDPSQLGAVPAECRPDDSAHHDILRGGSAAPALHLRSPRRRDEDVPPTARHPTPPGRPERWTRDLSDLALGLHLQSDSNPGRLYSCMSLLGCGLWPYLSQRILDMLVSQATGRSMMDRQ